MIEQRNRLLVLVSRLTEVPVDDIMSRCRRQDIAEARHLLMWALVALCGYTHTSVGILTQRSQATVAYAVAHVVGGYYGKKTEKLRRLIKNYTL